MKPSLRRIWVREHLGESVAEAELVEWATEALCEGLETPSLCILAGLNPVLDGPEMRDYFEKCLRELHLSRPPREATLVLHATEIAAALLAETLEVHAAIDQSYRILSELNYVGLLSGWYELDEARYEGYAYRSETQLATDARREAQKLIEAVRQAVESSVETANRH
jgi:hypothetical protein